MKLVTLETPAQLEQEGNVKITVELGDGQIGGGNIKLDNTQVGVTPTVNHPQILKVMRISSLCLVSI